MGLINNFYLKYASTSDIPGYILSRADISNGNIEILCFQRWYAVSEAVIEVLKPVTADYDDCSEVRVSRDSIPEIIEKAFKPFFNPHYREQHNYGYETDEGTTSRLIYCVGVLTWLYGFMEEHPDVQCYFVTSI